MLNFSDTFSQTMIITLFGMGIVFIVLIVLQYALKTMKLFNKNRKEDSPVAEVGEIKAVENAVAVEEQPVNYAEDDSLIAVITAAVIASLGGNSNIVVRKIRRVDDRTPAWGKVSRMEQMSDRF
ncbi:MAG TPA: OadG family protein [Negativicutes bacterium]|nr:OadG family protein [Negativicutes bacterium]